MEKVIEIKNLSKAYERYVVDGNNSSKKVRKLEYVLKDINLDIYKSDVVGIIGPNGSGKSTLLKILYPQQKSLYRFSFLPSKASLS